MVAVGNKDAGHMMREQLVVLTHLKKSHLACGHTHTHTYKKEKKNMYCRRDLQMKKPLK